MNIKKISLLILLHSRGLGRQKIWKLITQFGSPEKVVEAGLDVQKGILFDKWKVEDSYKKDLEIVEKSGVKLIVYDDPLYPKNLLKIPDFPLLLYVKGSLLQTEKCLALIGTRNATLYGKQWAESISKSVASCGVAIVSGLARGIDTTSHLGALDSGRTIAVIGSGLAKVYPTENRYLAEKISTSGALISEQPMETPPVKGLFPKRNRIVSGISDAVCLIESPLKGGGMLTMEIAENQSKPLFTIPGRLDWPTFSGNHYLIKEKKAQLVENGGDLLKHFEITKVQEIKSNSFPLLTNQEKAFLELLPEEEMTIEELVLLTQLPMMQLNVLLTRLLLKKVVIQFPGKIYKKMING